MHQDIALSGVIGALSYALDITEGQPAGHAVRSCMIGMRIAEQLQLPSADPVRPLLRAAAQGRRLLGQRRPDGGAVRRRRPDREARRRSCVDWSSPVRSLLWSLRTVAPGGSLRDRFAHLKGMHGRGRRHAQCDRDALRPRRRDRAHALPVGGDGRRDPQPRRALGRPRKARRPRAARRSRCSRGSSASRRRSRSSTPPGGVKAARAVAAAPARALVRPGAGRRAARRLPRSRVLGHARPPRRVRLGAGRPAAASPTTRASTGSPRRSPA